MIPGHLCHQLELDEKLDRRDGYSVLHHDEGNGSSNGHRRDGNGHAGHHTVVHVGSNGHSNGSSGYGNGHSHDGSSSSSSSVYGHPPVGHSHEATHRFVNTAAVDLHSPPSHIGTAVARKPFFTVPNHAPPIAPVVLPPPPIYNNHPIQTDNGLKGD